MSHYYSKTQESLNSIPQTIRYAFEGKTFVFKTDKGVFSKNHVDVATDVLLRHVDIKDNQRVLDLGCGYGVIGIILASTRQARVTLSDVNRRALDLTRENCTTHHIDATILESDGFTAIEESFDHIITNPPIRIGKKALYQLFTEAKEYLNKEGILWLVMHKKHGLSSALAYLGNIYHIDSVKRHKGFQVIRCKNR